MEQQSVTDMLDGEVFEAFRPELQRVKRLWEQYHNSNYQRVAAAIACGEVLEALNAKLPYGQFSKVLAWAEMPEMTAWRWRKLATVGLTAAEVIEKGGIAKVVDLTDVDRIFTEGAREVEIGQRVELEELTVEDALSEVARQMEQPIGPPSPKDGYRLNASGYKVRTKTISQHRQVMQDYLGRELLLNENIHHLNGEKADNRIENLELWAVPQPGGQRVTDLIAWAIELLAVYPPEMRHKLGKGQYPLLDHNDS